MEKNNKGLYYKLLILTAIAIPLLLSFSYAYFLAVVQGTENPTNMGGTSVAAFNFNLVTENDGYIDASNIIPIQSTSVESFANKAHFSVTTGINPYYINYSLLLTEIEMDSGLKISDFRWELTCTSCLDISKNASGNFSSVSGTEMTLKSDMIIPQSSEDEYELKIWLNDNNTDQSALLNKSFSAKVKAVAEFASTTQVLTAYGYQRIETLGNSYTQYIDTGITPSNTTKTEITYIDTSAAGSNYVFGSRTGMQATTIHYGIVGSVTGLRIASYYNTSSDEQQRYSKSRVLNEKYHIVLEIEHDETLGYRMHSIFDDLTNRNHEEYYSPYFIDGIEDNLPHLLVFAITNDPSHIHRGMALESLKIWDNGELVRDFIPCYRMSNQEGGLFDLVTGTFFDNDGTGTFIKGPIITN